MQPPQFPRIPLDNITCWDGEGGGECIDCLCGVFAGPEEGVVLVGGGGFYFEGGFACGLEEGVGVGYGWEVV